MMALRINTPYANAPSTQFKGNLHTHTTNSDGPLPPQDTVAAYAQRGYDFLMISDHDMITDIAALDAQGMTLLPGNEITDGGPHILHVGARERIAAHPDRQLVIDAINARGGLSIMNHPNWGENFVHCDQGTMEALTGYTGIEIYNGVSLRVEGSALATDRWDMLLSGGRRVWGFGNDDGHIPEDFGVAWNMVFAEQCEPEALYHALRLGRFYVSTGVRLDSIGLAENALRIRSADTECFRVYRDHGMLLATIDGPELIYEPPEYIPLSYLRVECHGRGARMAWTQPFFLA